MTPLLHKQPLKDKTPIRFRNGVHGESAPVWGEWQEGIVRVGSIRVKPIKRGGRTYPAGIVSIFVEGAVPEELGLDDWMGGVFNVEQYLVEIEGFTLVDNLA